MDARLVNLDQSISVGTTDEWWFWNSRDSMFEDWSTVPNVPTLPMYFFNTSLSATRCHQRRATIGRITHPVIGDLAKVDTSQFGVYDYVTPTGKRYQVEAEQDPGWCWDREVDIDDWYVTVDLHDVHGGRPAGYGFLDRSLDNCD